MKTVYNKIRSFSVTGIVPPSLRRHKFRSREDRENANPFHVIDDRFLLVSDSLDLPLWKVVYFFPKVATFVCPTEIVAYDNLAEEFSKLGAIVMGGSTDNEYAHLAWCESHPHLRDLKHYLFSDMRRDGLSLASQLGIVNPETGACLRATFILDHDNVIQHISVNNLDVGRSAAETLRILDALVTGELTACERPMAGPTINA